MTTHEQEDDTKKIDKHSANLAQEEMLIQILHCLSDIKYEIKYTQRILLFIAITLLIVSFLFAHFFGIIQTGNGNWQFWFNDSNL